MQANLLVPGAPSSGQLEKVSLVVPAHRGLDIDRVRYCLVKPRTAPRVLVRLGYECWRDVWKVTLQELEGATSITSDDFTRQDELGLLFEDEHVIGMTAYRWVDLSVAPHREDSYFKAWSDEAIESLIESGPRVCIGSYLTVAPAWRKTEAKSLLLALAVRRFLASPADVMAGTMRNDRGMNHIAYRLGARLLANATMHGVDVDLVAFDRNALEEDSGTPAKLDPAVRQLWKTRREGESP